jgi:predicted Zn-dependent peptidase|tara:strand:- start:15 stop:1031 length:1017 start_codon:yes stop_codon:yes gene_type:complete
VAIKGVHSNAGTGQSFMFFDAWGLDKRFQEMLERFHSVVFDFQTTEQSVREEISIIQQELEQREMETRFSEMLMKLMYPLNPHVQHLPGGTIEGVRAITLEKLHAFHKQWFHPQNMALIVTGNIGHQEVLDMLLKQPLPQNNGKMAHIKEPLHPLFKRSVYRCKDRPPELNLYFPRPEDEYDDVLIEFARDMLTQGMLSILVERLRTKEQKIYNAGAIPWKSIPMHFIIFTINLRPELFDEVEGEVLEEIEKLAKGQIPDDMFQMVYEVNHEHYATWKTEIDGDDWRDILFEEWVDGRIFHDNDMARMFARVTKEDVARAVREYWTKVHGCVHVILEE